MLGVYDAANYTSTLRLLTEIEATFDVSLGTSADLLHNRLSLWLTVNDLFGSRRETSQTVGIALSATATSKTSTRQVMLGLIYLLGQLRLRDHAWQGHQ